MLDLTIGRESGVENPRLAVKQEDKVSFWGKPGSVPKSVSRTHCHVVIDNDGTIMVEDITPNNFMYVNGQDCKRKENLSFSDTIELGPDRYRLELEDIVKALSSQQSFNISALKEVYDSFQKEKLDIQIRERRFNALSALPGILSMLSFGVAFCFQDNSRVYMMFIAALFAIVFALIRLLNAKKIPHKTRDMEDSFREKYVCPNPVCGRFLGFIPYKELLKNKTCPYCKSTFTEK